MRGARSVLAALLSLALSCSSEHGAPAPPPPEHAALGGEVAARVGSDVIPLALVVKVAAAQHIPPREALKRLVDDAVCANAARARGRDAERPASWYLTAARARITADRLLGEARQAGPATGAEIDELTLQYWREVDRPPAVRVVHAVALRPKKPDPAAEARARAVAEEIRLAVAEARDADDFLARAKAVPHPDVEVVAQPLSPFADDGYETEGGGRMDADFARAAFAVGGPGVTSGVVESSFGWHVIRMVERIPEQRMALEARRLAFAEEAFMLRARKATQARVKAQQASAPVQILPSAPLLMESLLAKPAARPTP